MWDDYRLYASVILITSLISIIITLVEAKNNMKRLREMSQFVTLVNVDINFIYISYINLLKYKVFRGIEKMP